MDVAFGGAIVEVHGNFAPSHSSGDIRGSQYTYDTGMPERAERLREVGECFGKLLRRIDQLHRKLIVAWLGKRWLQRPNLEGQILHLAWVPCLRQSPYDKGGAVTGVLGEQSLGWYAIVSNREACQIPGAHGFVPINK
ncbi:MAG: hypothetical protein IPK67_17315 [Planctomycetes bacterium]|nr:hypothetical protein [Planctomycetota bacterium]